MPHHRFLHGHARQMHHVAPMSATEIDEGVAALTAEGAADWRHDAALGALIKHFSFDNYFQTIAFVNALAWMIHDEDHHPELVVGYNRCEVRFSTHQPTGITGKDFVCAAKTDAIARRFYG